MVSILFYSVLLLDFFFLNRFKRDRKWFDYNASLFLQIQSFRLKKIVSIKLDSRSRLSNQIENLSIKYKTTKQNQQLVTHKSACESKSTRASPLA